MKNDDIGNRIKGYEKISSLYLTPRMPIIIRCDGKNFHSYTKKMDKPFDEDLIHIMTNTAQYLCQEIQGAELAYVQSDEISILVHYYKNLNSSPWFDNKVQKIVSISAGLASSYFTLQAIKHPASIKFSKYPVVFDSRVFVLPEEEVCNYMLWREMDASRNSVQMLARSLYSHKECNNKNNSQLQEMCFQKGHNWNDLPTHQKRGLCIKKIRKEERTFWEEDLEIPIFSQDRNYVEEHLKREE